MKELLPRIEHHVLLVRHNSTPYQPSWKTPNCSIADLTQAISLLESTHTAATIAFKVFARRVDKAIFSWVGWTRMWFATLRLSMTLLRCRSRLASCAAFGCIGKEYDVVELIVHGFLDVDWVVEGVVGFFGSFGTQVDDWWTWYRVGETSMPLLLCFCLVDLSRFRRLENWRQDYGNLFAYVENFKVSPWSP